MILTLRHLKNTSCLQHSGHHSLAARIIVMLTVMQLPCWFILKQEQEIIFYLVGLKASWKKLH